MVLREFIVIGVFMLGVNNIPLGVASYGRLCSGESWDRRALRVDRKWGKVSLSPGK